jgi:hypothetical protein
MAVYFMDTIILEESSVHGSLPFKLPIEPCPCGPTREGRSIRMIMTDMLNVVSSEIRGLGKSVA